MIFYKLARGFSRSLLPLLILLFSAASLLAQNSGKIGQWLEGQRLTGTFQEVEMLQQVTPDGSPLAGIVDNAAFFQVEKQALRQVYFEPLQTMTLQIPREFNDNFELELARTDILSDDFRVSTDKQANVPMDRGVHYWGIVKGHPNSLAAVSIFEDGMMLMISDETGDFQMGKMEDGSENYILYRVADLKAENPIKCFTEEQIESETQELEVSERYVGCKVVKTYFECDYQLFLDRGSNTTNVVNYVTGLFNQVAILYTNEDVDMDISEIFVWTSTDPYVSYTSTSTLLPAFRTTRGTNFNGDLAHFLTTRSVGGGIAYLDVLCNKPYSHAVSMIYNSYSNVPTYSWSVMVVAHEAGHNIGSWHTHSCNWPGGAIDNCYTPEGSCSTGPPPTNGGTVMSYCHLTSYGINFNNGFGPLPGQKLRDKVIAASCLSQNGEVPAGLATSNITQSSATVSWGAVSGASDYTVQYKISTSSTWTNAGTTTSTSMNLTNLSAGITYNWQVKTNCSAYSASATFTTLAGSGCSVPTGLVTSNITNSTATFTWGAVGGAANYTVQYKKSTSGTWITKATVVATTYNITGLSGSTTYNWRVKADCSAYSAAATFTTTTSSCSKPTNLVNNSVGSTSATVSWNPSSGAVNYTVQYRPSTSGTYVVAGTVTGTSITINGLSPSTLYYWRVKANCSTYSNAKTFTTTSSLINPDQLGDPELKVYPNPAEQVLNLDFSGLLFPGTQAYITDATGRLVLESPMLQAVQTVDIARLAPGLYVVTIVQNGRRLVVERFVKM